MHAVATFREINELLIIIVLNVVKRRFVFSASSWNAYVFRVVWTRPIQYFQNQIFSIEVTMDGEDTVITCAVSVEWVNAQGISVRKFSHKLATLRLIRSDTRELFIEVQTEKAPTATRLSLRDIVVHKKFMSEGKASIKFNREKCTLYASNAPPGLLMNFLRTLFIKMTSANSQDSNKLQDVRTRMLSENPSKFDDISPVTNVEIARARKFAGLSKATPTTPSPPSKKRKFDQVGGTMKNESNAKGNLMKKANVEKTVVDAEPQVRLNDEQNEVLRACINGKNVFFTGSAGTGKSFLLKKIISVLPPDGTPFLS